MALGVEVGISEGAGTGVSIGDGRVGSGESNRVEVGVSEGAGIGVRVGVRVMVTVGRCVGEAVGLDDEEVPVGVNEGPACGVALGVEAGISEGTGVAGGTGVSIGDGSVGSGESIGDEATARPGAAEDRGACVKKTFAAQAIMITVKTARG